MNWDFLFSAAIVFGVVVVLIFGYASQTQERVSKYKKTRRLRDLLKIFSRY